MVKDLIGDKNLPQEALCVDNYKDACTIQEVLLNNGFVVMMGREEGLYTLNWIWTQNSDANRNDVIFYERDLYFFQMHRAQDEENQ